MLAGWLVTFSLLSIFGIRSIVYQWKAMPRKHQEQWPDLSRTPTIELRLLIGIGLLTLLSFIAALIVCGLLIIGIANAITARSHLVLA
jgi:predicted MFS family arabinose efflux permease